MYFISPTSGKITVEEMSDVIIKFIQSDILSRYKLIIGTDSNPGDQICFVTAVIIYREGKGGRYFYRRSYTKKNYSLKQRIFMEATLSLEVANAVEEILIKRGIRDLNVEIHLDVGNNGKTKEIIKELVGMINGCGFIAYVKPDSYGATKVADRYSKCAQ